MERALTLTAPPGSAATGAERRILLAVCLATTLVPLGSTMIAVALPDVRADFHIRVSTAVWLVTAYLVTTAASQPVVGGLGDRLGRRRLVVGGAMGFGLASLLAAAAPDFPLLVTARCAQSVAGALALVNAAATVRAVLPAERRGRAYGMVAASATLAAAAGPPIGGVAVAVAGWRGTFLAGLPLVAVAVLAAARWLPADAGQQASAAWARHRFDLPGALLLLATLTCGAVLLNRLTQQLPVGVAVALAAATLALGTAFVTVERHHVAPVLDVRVLRVRAVAAAGAAVGTANLAVYLVLLAIPLLLAGRTSSVGAGALLVAFLGGTSVAAFVGGRLSDRWGRRAPAVCGGAVLAAAMLALTQIDIYHQLAATVIVLVLGGAGQGVAAAAVQAAGAEALPAARAGVASGVWSSCRYLGSIIGTSVLAVLVHGGAERPVFVVAAVAAAVSTAAAVALLAPPGRRLVSLSPSPAVTPPPAVIPPPAVTPPPAVVPSEP